MLQKCFIVCAGLLALSFPPVELSAEMVFTDDLSGFANNISDNQSGGDQGQVITSSVGMSQGTVNAIDGDSIFVTIDTTSVDPVGSGSYGGGIQTIIDGAFTAGDLTSSDPLDYNFVFDIAANGFAPEIVNIFLQFRNQFNDNQLGGAQPSFSSQNSMALNSAITSLGSNDDAVSVSIPFSEFQNFPSDLSGLATSDRIQFQITTRSVDSSYSADAGNVLVLDNIGVNLTATAVPEPSSLLYAAVGGLTLIRRRRVKQTQV